jgi:hypothetical protein
MQFAISHKHWRIVGMLVALVILSARTGLVAHDIPADVTIQAFAKPEGERLRVLVRVPLRAMRDIDFPKRGPGFLDLSRADRSLRTAAQLWITDSLAIYEDDTALGAPNVSSVRVSLPSDRSFESYETALSHLAGPRLPDDTEIVWEQGMLDVSLEYPIRSDQSRLSIRPAWARLGVRVVTVLRFIPPGGAVRAFEYVGDPGLVRLDPRWHQAAWQFVKAGFFHILDGTDHLLFLLCLVVPLRRIKPLVVVVTAFTVAHSVTLIASAYGVAPDALWFPPLVETLIAVSIVYMALENIVLGAQDGQQLGRRWIITFGFGLVHGFGFSFALRETMQFAGTHLLTSLLSFNIGVELGQLLVLALIVPALNLLVRYVVEERIGTIILSSLVAHTAWHWTTERAERLRQFGWPALDPAVLAQITRGLMIVVIAAGVWWLLRRRAVRPDGGTSPAPDAPEAGS